MLKVYNDNARMLSDKDKLTVSKGPSGINIFCRTGKELFRTFHGKNEVQEGDELFVITDSVEGHPVAKLLTISEYGKEADKIQVSLFKTALADAREVN